jgi:glycosyltransferase involved in cell wall biosynthesis
VKVALVAPLVSAIREPQTGGSQAFLSELARGLVERGHDVDVYAASGSEIRGVRVIDTGVDHRELSATLYRSSSAVTSGSAVAESSFGRVYAVLRQSRYDVVHNHAFDAPAVRLASALDAPVVHTLHLPPDRPLAQALREASRCDPAPTVACVSAHQANAWRALVPVDVMLPPLIPTRLIHFSPSAGSGAVFAGRLSPEKGAAEAIAIARVARIQIDVFGDRYDEQYARTQIDPRRAEPGVVVHPGVPQTELWGAMASAAAVLCPAKWEEPFGMVAAEAQACGTPVVAFRCGAFDEVMVAGVTGFLVAPNDLRAAADALGRAPALSRRAVREHAEKHLDAHERLYEQLVSGRVPGGRMYGGRVAGGGAAGGRVAGAGPGVRSGG